MVKSSFLEMEEGHPLKRHDPPLDMASKRHVLNRQAAKPSSAFFRKLEGREVIKPVPFCLGFHSHFSLSVPGSWEVRENWV